MQKLQNRSHRKIHFKKFHHPIKHIYKDHKIFKIYQRRQSSKLSFQYQVEQNNSLATSFSALHSRDKHNYQTRSGTQNQLDVTLARINKYDKESDKVSMYQRLE